MDRNPCNAQQLGRRVTIKTLVIFVLLLAGTPASYAQTTEPLPLTERGQVLVTRMCAECHAVGKAGKSPRAGAPAFRQLDRRLDLDTFIDRLREGLDSGHRDMPMFRFTREDAHAVVAYLRSIQAP
jgi:mono/diheme cytochrome c family protein